MTRTGAVAVPLKAGCPVSPIRFDGYETHSGVRCAIYLADYPDEAS